MNFKSLSFKVYSLYYFKQNKTHRKINIQLKILKQKHNLLLIIISIQNRNISLFKVQIESPAPTQSLAIILKGSRREGHSVIAWFRNISPFKSEIISLIFIICTGCHINIQFPRFNSTREMIDHRDLTILRSDVSEQFSLEHDLEVLHTSI